MVAQTKDFTQPTGRPDLDGALATLRSKADERARTTVAERLALLRRFLDGYVAVAEESVLAGLKMKGIDPASPAAAEEWFAGPTIVIRNIRLLIETLEKIQRGQPTIDASRIETRADGRV